MHETNLEQIRKLTYELDEVDYLLPSVSNLVEMVMLARDNPVLVTDGETITFLNAQALELFKSIDPEADFIGQPISDFVTKFCPSFASRVNVHRAEEEELEFSVVIHRHQLPAFGSEPFYAVIARGGVSGGE